MTFWFRFGLGFVMAGFQAAIKNAKSRADMREAAKAMFDTIVAAYPEFLER